MVYRESVGANATQRPLSPSRKSGKQEIHGAGLRPTRQGLSAITTKVVQQIWSVSQVVGPREDVRLARQLPLSYFRFILTGHLLGLLALGLAYTKPILTLL